MKQIAFLRGINLGGARRVSMAELRTLLESLGYQNVRTFLQSGNVVLESRVSGRRLEQELAKAIAGELGLETQVAVRSRKELADVIARDPLGDVVDSPARYQVSFLSAKPAARVVRELSAEDVAPEQCVVSGREIYAWHPGGIHKSKLAKLLTERRLGVGVTARNWNTITKLLAIADE